MINDMYLTFVKLILSSGEKELFIKYLYFKSSNNILLQIKMYTL